MYNVNNTKPQDITNITQNGEKDYMSTVNCSTQHADTIVVKPFL